MSFTKQTLCSIHLFPYISPLQLGLCPGTTFFAPLLMKLKLIGTVWLNMQLFWQFGMLVMFIFAPLWFMCMILLMMFVVPGPPFCPFFGLNIFPLSPQADGAVVVVPISGVCWAFSVFGLSFCVFENCFSEALTPFVLLVSSVLQQAWYASILMFFLVPWVAVAKRSQCYRSSSRFDLVLIWSGTGSECSLFKLAWLGIKQELIVEMLLRCWAGLPYWPIYQLCILVLMS